MHSFKLIHANSYAPDTEQFYQERYLRKISGAVLQTNERKNFLQNFHPSKITSYMVLIIQTAFP